MKQIETFMDSKYDSGILSGMNMIEICTSSNHYLPAHLFKPLYSLLLVSNVISYVSILPSLPV